MLGNCTVCNKCAGKTLLLSLKFVLHNRSQALMLEILLEVEGSQQKQFWIDLSHLHLVFKHCCDLRVKNCNLPNCLVFIIIEQIEYNNGISKSANKNM